MENVNSSLKGSVSRISSTENKAELLDSDALKFWKFLPSPERKLVVVAGSALGENFAPFVS